MQILKRLKATLRPPMLPKPRTQKMRIAVTGYSGSGKTAFLTSLVSHLRNHKTSRFRLSDPDALIAEHPREQDRHPRKPDQWPQFPFEQHYAMIANHSSWPVKTTDCSEYTLDLGVSTWLLHRARLTLYDLPGERFADAAMSYMDFFQWSQEQLNWLNVAVHAHNGNRPSPPACQGLDAVRRYLCLLRDGPAQESAGREYVAAYKQALAELVCSYHVYATPSYFLLDRQGRTAAEVVGEPDAANQRCSGLPGQEFCPLAPRFWDGCPQLVECFEGRYKAYRETIVTPVFEKLAACDGLIILVDVADILQCGAPQLNDVDYFLQQILKALQPGGDVVRALLRRIGLAPHIKRIAVAASQCDRFHPDDAYKLQSLVERLAGPYLARIPGIQSQFFACAAIKSTTFVDGNLLRGRVCRVQPGETPGDEESYQVDRIPDDWDDNDGWPSHWDETKFGSIPPLWPRVPAVFKAVPEHIALDELFRFVTGW
jgi:uncharacterized protein